MSDIFGGGDVETSVSSQPWQPAQRYLTGQDKFKYGVMPEARKMYGQAVTDILPNIKKAGDITTGVASDILGGKYNVQGIDAQDISPVAARAAQGQLDPTQSLARLLSGNVDNPYLNAQAQAITNQVNANLMNTLLPQIRSGATAAGQYGSSRQGIAESGAISGTQRQLSDALANLYGGAYENAQQRMMGAALPLNQQAVDIANANQQNRMEAARINAAAQQANLAAQLQGVQSLYGGVTMPYNFRQGALQNYANIINPIASLGTSQTQVQPGQGPLPGIIGTAMAASGLGWKPFGP